MAIYTEGLRDAEFLVSEAEDFRSRDEVTVTVPANTTILAGTILGAITASGKFVRHDAGAADGSEAEAAILLLEQVNATGSAVDVQAAVISRAAQVNADRLTYEDGADDAQKTASNAALGALGIIVRNT